MWITGGYNDTSTGSNHCCCVAIETAPRGRSSAMWLMRLMINALSVRIQKCRNAQNQIYSSDSNLRAMCGTTALQPTPFWRAGHCIRCASLVSLALGGQEQEQRSCLRRGIVRRLLRRERISDSPPGRFLPMTIIPDRFRLGQQAAAHDKTIPEPVNISDIRIGHTLISCFACPLAGEYWDKSVAVPSQCRKQPSSHCIALQVGA